MRSAGAYALSGLADRPGLRAVRVCGRSGSAGGPGLRAVRVCGRSGSAGGPGLRTRACALSGAVAERASRIRRRPDLWGSGATLPPEPPRGLNGPLWHVSWLARAPMSISTGSHGRVYVVYVPTGTSTSPRERLRTSISHVRTPSSHVDMCMRAPAGVPRCHAAFLRAPMGSCRDIPLGSHVACLRALLRADLRVTLGVSSEIRVRRRVVPTALAALSAVGGRRPAADTRLTLCPALWGAIWTPLATSRIYQIRRAGLVGWRWAWRSRSARPISPLERAGIGCRRSGLPRNVQRSTADDADLPAKRPTADCSRRGSPRGTSSGRLPALWVPAVRTAAGCLSTWIAPRSLRRPTVRAVDPPVERTAVGRPGNGRIGPRSE
jgi:hypothetical protein